MIGKKAVCAGCECIEDSSRMVGVGPQKHLLCLSCFEEWCKDVRAFAEKIARNLGAPGAAKPEGEPGE